MRSLAIVVDLRFLQFEVEIEPALLGVIENHSPLVELGTVVVEFVGRFDERPDVVAVAADIVSQKREGVAPFARQVIESADQSFAAAILPGGIARTPVADMRGVAMQPFGRGFTRTRCGVGRTQFAGVVEVGKSEERLRRIGASLEEEPLGARKPQMVFADVLEAALATEIATGLVGGFEIEVAVLTVERTDG